MKILLASSRYSPDISGGAERVAQTLAETLLAMGHAPVVLTTRRRDEPDERVVNGVRVRAVTVRNVYDLRDRRHAAPVKSLWHLIDSWNPWMIGAVAPIIREEKPEIIHSHLLTGFSVSLWKAARDAGVPVIHVALDHYLLCARSGMSIEGKQCVKRH